MYDYNVKLYYSLTMFLKCRLKNPSLQSKANKKEIIKILNHPLEATSENEEVKFISLLF